MTDCKVFCDNLEETAQKQIDTLVKHPAFEGAKIRIMPDAHAGAGCVIGFTADLGDKVVPNLVGVDIGCGMYTAPIYKPPGLSIGELLEDFSETIEKHIPSGFNIHKDCTPFAFLRKAYEDELLENLRCYDYLKNPERFPLALGSLGGGNHFIEIAQGCDQELKLIIHSGSRNLGNQVATHYHKLALEQNPAGDLSYLTGELASDYLYDMKLCQSYARANRLLMACLIGVNLSVNSVVRVAVGFHTTHNYIGDDGIVRKGAISAKLGERVIVPMNMSYGSIVGIGMGNEDWNNSAPHGAGRIMSRGQARREIDMEDFIDSMDGIYTKSVCSGTIDEAPQAYKAPQDIIDRIGDTVKVVDILKPLYNFKARN